MAGGIPVHLRRIDLVVVGAAGGDAAALAADYERRLSRYARLAVHELKGEPLQRGEQHVRATEGARIVRAIDSAAGSGQPSVVALDSRGEQLASEPLARRLLGEQHLVLVVGGAAGIDQAVLQRATWTLSLGKVTLPHQLARVVLVEQLYRAFRIARGEPYHH